MAIPDTITLEDVDGNSVEMSVIGTGAAECQGERRTYLALMPAEAWDGDEAIALIVRWIEAEGVVAIEDDDEFQAALDALEMEA
ncbi:MAG: DUF1292 domain-containing protein [Candidatus Sericytochromatia bacterium]|nr:DUF1292 domain-containing protein [Candidatus Tanganyikabacteria bacterium]